MSQSMESVAVERDQWRGLALQHLSAGNAQAAVMVLRTALESFPEKTQSE